MFLDFEKKRKGVKNVYVGLSFRGRLITLVFRLNTQLPKVSIGMLPTSHICGVIKIKCRPNSLVYENFSMIINLPTVSVFKSYNSSKHF